MANKIVEVLVERSDGNSLSSSFVAKIFDEMIVPIDNNIMSFGLSLAEKLMEIAKKENCDFLLIDAINKKEYRYSVSCVKDMQTGEYKLNVQVQNQDHLPAMWSINKRFYNWFAGISKPKS
ncbi:MAG: hypothetical protein GXO85_06630 [Chlorobi bacterium]|nr:hypothetical protein [Chlorobiota bacterium]